MAQAAVGTVSNLQSREPGPEVLEKVDKVIEAYRGKEGALIPVLHEVQQIAADLPRCVLRRIARGLAVPESEVYGVVTFYSLFTMTAAEAAQDRGVHGHGVLRERGGGAAGGRPQRLGRLRGRHLARRPLQPGGDPLHSTRAGLAPVLSVDGEIYSRVEPEVVPTRSWSGTRSSPASSTSREEAAPGPQPPRRRARGAAFPALHCSGAHASSRRDLSIIAEIVDFPGDQPPLEQEVGHGLKVLEGPEVQLRGEAVLGGHPFHHGQRKVQFGCGQFPRVRRRDPGPTPRRPPAPARIPPPPPGDPGGTGPGPRRRWLPASALRPS